MVLVYPPSLDFIISFIACLKAGIIAVPVYPPDPMRLNKDLNMFASLVQACGAQTALTSNLYNYATKVATITTMFSGRITWPTLNWIVTDSFMENK